METFRSVVASIQREDFLAYIGLSEAYLHIPVRTVHWRFLKFAKGGRHLQY